MWDDTLIEGLLNDCGHHSLWFGLDCRAAWDPWKCSWKTSSALAVKSTSHRFVLAADKLPAGDNRRESWMEQAGSWSHGARLWQGQLSAKIRNWYRHLSGCVWILAGLNVTSFRVFHFSSFSCFCCCRPLEIGVYEELSCLLCSGASLHILQKGCRSWRYPRRRMPVCWVHVVFRLVCGHSTGLTALSAW